MQAHAGCLFLPPAPPPAGKLPAASAKQGKAKQGKSSSRETERRRGNAQNGAWQGRAGQGGGQAQKSRRGGILEPGKLEQQGEGVVQGWHVSPLRPRDLDAGPPGGSPQCRLLNERATVGDLMDPEMVVVIKNTQVRLAEVTDTALNLRTIIVYLLLSCVHHAFLFLSLTTCRSSHDKHAHMEGGGWAMSPMTVTLVARPTCPLDSFMQDTLW